MDISLYSHGHLLLYSTNLQGVTFGSEKPADEKKLRLYINTIFYCQFCTMIPIKVIEQQLYIVIQNKL